jgi:hypothetical protein
MFNDFYLPTITVPTNTQQPMFRTSVDCPIPREWIVSAFIVGLVVGVIYARN